MLVLFVAGLLPDAFSVGRELLQKQRRVRAGILTLRARFAPFVYGRTGAAA